MTKNNNNKNFLYSEKTIKNLNKNIDKNFKHLFKITPEMTKSLSGVSRLVMLDRYAQKDLELKNLLKDDVVIAKIKDDKMFPTLGLGVVLKTHSNNETTIKIDEEFWKQIDKSHNPKKGVIRIENTLLQKPLELFFEQIATRVGNYIGKSDEKYKNKFVEELSSFNIVPAGRILYGAGSNTTTTFFNCYVMPFIKDSRDGIADHRKEVMEIMSRGGGVGTNGSTLRPRNCEAITVRGKSSGAVSWLNDLAMLTNLIEQGGSRRGAQMIMLSIWHPDVIEFIISKMQNADVLRYISKNFKDKTIKKFAEQKLKFTPLSKDQKTLHEIIVKNENNKFTDSLIALSKLKLDSKGVYEVNNPEFLSGANISIAITDDFMEAVKNDDDYKLQFPDIIKMSSGQKLVYDHEWHNIGDVREWKNMNYPVKTYKKIKARELWELINFCATYSAEPGVFFIDTANKDANAKSYDQKIICTNPCGEQPLAPYSVCNLAAINLDRFIDRKTKEIKWDKLKSSVQTAVRFLDNVIDLTPYFLEKNELQASGERRVGLGVMGYHDLLIWKGLRYGSKVANELTDKLFKFIASNAYLASAKLAREKGRFPFLKNLNKLLKSNYITKLPKNVIDEITSSNGIRNSHLLTVAPTGSTGTLVGVSTGLEPYFAFKYFRSGRLGKFMEVEQKIVSEWKKINNWSDKKLPEEFVSAMELSPKEHVDVQVIIQKWVDSSISKTVNAPKGYTVKQVSKIYEQLYKRGAKGGTVYVDGSRNAQVLSLTNDDEIKTKEKIKHVFVTNMQAVEESQEKQANVPSNVANRAIGTKVGNICPVCKEGVIEKIGGCNSCTLCNAQLKCDI